MATASELEITLLEEQLARKQRMARLLRQQISKLQLRIHDARRAAEAREASHDPQ